MTYLLKTNRNNFPKKNIFVLICIVLLIFLISWFGFGKSFLKDTSLPLFSLGDKFYNKVFSQDKSFDSEDELIKENEQLSKEIENLRISFLDYQTLLYENQELRKELSLRDDEDSVTASIIGRYPQITLDTLLIDRGKEDGINVGDLVLAGERVAVGTIKEVSKKGAIVALNSFPKVKTSGFIARTGEAIELGGSGGGSIEASVPIDFDIQISDRVFINQSRHYFGATVSSIEENQSLGLKEVLLSLPVDISRVKVLFIKPVFRGE